MARFAFALLGQETGQLMAGLLVKIKDDDSGNFVASTSPGDGQIQLVDNNDGTYFCDGLPSGEYSVYNNETPQEELQNVPHVNSDVITHKDASAPHAGHATQTDLDTHEADSAVHQTLSDSSTATDKVWSANKIQSELDGKEAVDATILRTTDVIDNLTGTDTDKPLSAAQGKALQDNKIVESVDTNDFEVSSNQLKLKNKSFGSVNYMKSANTIHENLVELDKQLFAQSTKAGVTYRRSVWFMEAIATSAVDNAVTELVWSNNGDGTERIKDFFAYHRMAVDTKLVLFGEYQTTNPIQADVKLKGNGATATFTDTDGAGSWTAFSVTLDVSQYWSDDGIFSIEITLTGTNDALEQVKLRRCGVYATNI